MNIHMKKIKQNMLLTNAYVTKLILSQFAVFRNINKTILLTVLSLLILIFKKLILKELYTVCQFYILE